MPAYDCCNPTHLHSIKSIRTDPDAESLTLQHTYTVNQKHQKYTSLYFSSSMHQTQELAKTVMMTIMIKTTKKAHLHGQNLFRLDWSKAPTHWVISVLPPERKAKIHPSSRYQKPGLVYAAAQQIWQEMCKNNFPIHCHAQTRKYFRV